MVSSPPSLKIAVHHQMANSILHFRPPTVLPCAASGDRKPDRRGSPNNWWTPLFGWSSEPDYIESGAGNLDLSVPGGADGKAEADLVQKSVRSRLARGCFTKEKAKQLRMMTTGSESFHDAMYHSAIASRLASEFSDS